VRYGTRAKLLKVFWEGSRSPQECDPGAPTPAPKYRSRSLHDRRPRRKRTPRADGRRSRKAMFQERRGPPGFGGHSQQRIGHDGKKTFYYPRRPYHPAISRDENPNGLMPGWGEGNGFRELPGRLLIRPRRIHPRDCRGSGSSSRTRGRGPFAEKALQPLRSFRGCSSPPAHCRGRRGERSSRRWSAAERVLAAGRATAVSQMGAQCAGLFFFDASSSRSRTPAPLRVPNARAPSCCLRCGLVGWRVFAGRYGWTFHNQNLDLLLAFPGFFGEKKNA